MRRLGKWSHWLLSPLIAVVSSRTQPRVRVEVRTDDGYVLLVKSWFSSQQWSLPGGGVEKGEAPTHAAIRELYEETGLHIDKKQLVYIATCEASWPLRCDIVLYGVTLPTMQDFPVLPWIRRLEIIDRMWCPIDQLPSDTGRLTAAIIARMLPDSE